MNHPNSDIVRQVILDGDAEQAAALAKQSLEAGLDPLQALEPFVAAIRHAGELFEEGDFFLPQLLLASNAMKAALGVLFPQSGDEPDTRPTQGTVVAGTVQGDIHEIGKNLVCALLTAHGFRVVDLGGDVPLDKFVDQARQLNADLVALSALLTTTMIQQKNLIDKLESAGLRGKVKVMVGGAPVNAAWAKSIGADGYAPDAARAVDEAFRLMGKPRG
jgi:corrinoid protein of di/trimethylamine methyltransferase